MIPHYSAPRSLRAIGRQPLPRYPFRNYGKFTRQSQRKSTRQARQGFGESIALLCVHIYQEQAAFGGHDIIVSAPLKCNIDVNYLVKWVPNTALAFACMHGYFATRQLLRDAGAVVPFYRILYSHDNLTNGMGCHGHVVDGQRTARPGGRGSQRWLGGPKPNIAKLLYPARAAPPETAPQNGSETLQITNCWC